MTISPICECRVVKWRDIYDVLDHEQGEGHAGE